MIVILFRLLILIALLLLIFTAYQYFQNPIRKLQHAKKNGDFFYLDNSLNSKKNLQFVYKGCLFEGEKYLGTTDQSFDVVNIQVFAHDPLELRGVTKDDLFFLEEELLIHYPYAKIEWRHPINQLM